MHPVPELGEGHESYHGSRREEVGVIAALFEVHHHIEQRDLVSSSTSVQGLKVTCQDELVIFPGLQEEEEMDQKKETLHMGRIQITI